LETRKESGYSRFVGEEENTNNIREMFMKVFAIATLLTLALCPQITRAEETITGRVCAIDFDNGYDSSMPMYIAYSCDGGPLKSGGEVARLSTDDTGFAKVLSGWIRKFQDSGFSYAGCGGKDSLFSQRCLFIKTN
jgi:hypothetical protein